MTRAPGCTCSRSARAWDDAPRCATCGQRVLESQLTPVLLQILCGGTGLVLARNAQGYDAERRIKYGLGPGSADYVGLYSRPPLPALYVEVEMKSPDGRLSTEQRARQQFIARLNGVYAVVRCEADARVLLDRLRGCHG